MYLFQYSCYYFMAKILYEVDIFEFKINMNILRNNVLYYLILRKPVFEFNKSGL